MRISRFHVISLLLVLLLWPPVPAQDDQHLVLGQDAVESTPEAANEVPARRETLREVEQRLEAADADAQRLEQEARDAAGAVDSAKSALSAEEEAQALVSQTIEVNQRRLEGLGSLAEDLRQARDESAAAFERRVSLLYLARLNAENFIVPGDDSVALHEVTWRASARHAAMRSDGAQQAMAKARSEAQRMREVLAGQQSMAESRGQDTQRLREELAEAEQGLQGIEARRAQATEQQAVLQDRQEALRDLLSLLEERQAVQAQPQAIERPLNADQALVMREFPPTPAPPMAGQHPAPPRQTPVAVLPNSSALPGIEVATDGPQTVFVVVGGEVQFAGELRGFGQIVVLQHPGDYYTVYAYLGRLLVQEGEELAAGDVLGLSGALETSRTGRGVRLEVRRGDTAISPESWREMPLNPAAALVQGRRAIEP